MQKQQYTGLRPVGLNGTRVLAPQTAHKTGLTDLFCLAARRRTLHSGQRFGSLARHLVAKNSCSVAVNANALAHWQQVSNLSVKPNVFM
jgi:hypothetical protein